MTPAAGQLAAVQKWAVLTRKAQGTSGKLAIINNSDECVERGAVERKAWREVKR